MIAKHGTTLYRVACNDASSLVGLGWHAKVKKRRQGRGRKSGSTNQRVVEILVES